MQLFFTRQKAELHLAVFMSRKSCMNSMGVTDAEVQADLEEVSHALYSVLCGVMNTK